MQVSLTEYMKEIENGNRKEEILHFQSVLAEFKITFSELAKESPKHRDTREHLIEIVKMIKRRGNDGGAVPKEKVTA